MVDDRPPTLPKKRKVGNNSRKPRIKPEDMTKQQLQFQIKLGLMKDCQIFGKSFESSKLYFKSKGYELGHTTFTTLRKELESTDNAKEWFSQEALVVIRDDHKLSVERIRMLENRLLEEFEQVSATNFYKYLNAGTPEQQVIRNKAHDANLLLRIIAQFQSLQETKTKMFSATPLVQELMEVHARQEEEANRPTPAPTEDLQTA
jgi:hypothetical protein